MYSKTFEQKKYFLISEVKTALILYGKGMNDLKGLSRGLDNLRYQVDSLEFILIPMFLLSSSFERLIKCLLCLVLLDERGEFEEKPYKYKERDGHNLVYLLNRLIIVITRKENLSKFSPLSSDIEFLKKDKALKEIVKALSNFGLGARYYNLDMVLKGKSTSESPIKEWDVIEMNILSITRGLDEVLKIPRHKRIAETQKDIIETIEKFFHILRSLFELAGIRDFTRGINY